MPHAASHPGPVSSPPPGAAPGGIELRGITKAFGATVANYEVDFDLRPGEIHALLGENGAGKTTLMSVLFGLVTPDAGEIMLAGEPVSFESPHDALQRGIGMVHQHFMLVPGFTVAENVVLGSVSPWNMKLRRGSIEQSVAEAAERFGMAIDPRRRIRDLPIDVQQRVEILKLLYRGARSLILDEPTSTLGPAQIEALFATLRDLRESGHAVVIVTHKLSEVMQIADRVTVLKAGRKTMTVERGSFDEHSLALAMTGRELQELPPRTQVEEDRPLLEVRNLRTLDRRGHHVVDGVSFTVRAGEILGVAGVEGNGQSELVETLAGVLHPCEGEVLVDAVDVTRAHPSTLHEHGLSAIPEDRHGWGLVLDMSVAENLALAAVPEGRFTRYGLLRRRAIRAQARHLLEEYDVRPPDPDLRVASLSGGNQQKVVLARELARQPKVLVAAQPTHGLDVGAADYVQRCLLDVRERGGAVVLVSNDLDELLKLSDSLIVLYRGRIYYEAPVADVSIRTLAMAMAGTDAAKPVAEVA
ncbi:MAG: heme ABC transporter ATP-binding protein [Candidatus Rokuibacteriota bacterium]|nr:MAG: heme ABC transporter ATP-binding protein [Candidatus Rokubacteria bacterium]